MSAAADDHSDAGRQPSLTASVADAEQFEGWLDHVSLTLTVHRTREQLIEGLKIQSQDAPLNDLARTYVHELAHAGQALGTTLGYHTWMLRSAQVDYVVRMLKWLAYDAKLPIRTPLITYLPSLTEYDDKAAGLVHGWQIAESLISELAGSVGGYLHSAVQLPVAGTTWAQRWSRLQSNILELYETEDTKWPEAFFLALHYERVIPVPDDYMAMVATLPAAPHFTVPSVMESAALGVELSPADEAGLADALQRASSTRTTAQLEMYNLLGRTRRAYPAVSARSLLATHLAACDVALNPPCLPCHLADRAGVDFRELHPVARCLEVWRVLGDGVRAASDIGDALRCSDDICEALGWTRTTTVIRTAADSYGTHGRDPRGRAFATAMKGRLAYPPLLHNPSVPLWGNGPLADLYLTELTPAFWVFDDDWSPGGKDPTRSHRLLGDTVRTQWTRSMMLGRPTTLRTPVQLPDEIREQLAETLVQELSDAVGRQLRPPTIDNP